MTKKYRWECPRCTAACAIKPDECFICGADGEEFEEVTDLEPQ